MCKHCEGSWPVDYVQADVPAMDVQIVIEDVETRGGGGVPAPGPLRRPPILSILSFSRKRPDRFLLYTGYHGRGTAFPAGMPVFYRRGFFRRSPPGLWLNLERSLPHDSPADP